MSKNAKISLKTNFVCDKKAGESGLSDILVRNGGQCKAIRKALESQSTERESMDTTGERTRTTERWNKQVGHAANRTSRINHKAHRVKH